MGSEILVIGCVVGIGVFLLLVMFVLPQRRLPEEKEAKPLYEERCSAHWRLAKGAIIAGGNIPIARISFYEDFFVVALGTLTKVYYSDVISACYKSSWLSSSIAIHFAKGRSLLIHPKNFKKVRSLIETRVSHTS